MRSTNTIRAQHSRLSRINNAAGKRRAVARPLKRNIIQVIELDFIHEEAGTPIIMIKQIKLAAGLRPRRVRVADLTKK